MKAKKMATLQREGGQDVGRDFRDICLSSIS